MIVMILFICSPNFIIIFSLLGVVHFRVTVRDVHCPDLKIVSMTSEVSKLFPIYMLTLVSKTTRTGALNILFLNPTIKYHPGMQWI